MPDLNKAPMPRPKTVDLGPDHICCGCFIGRMMIPGCDAMQTCCCQTLCDGSEQRDLPQWLIDKLNPDGSLKGSR